MNNSHKMNSIQYFLWLSMQAFGGVLIIPGPLFFAVLLLAVSSAAIYECAFCDTNSLWVFIFFANPVFVLIGGTLGINVKAPPQIRSSLDTEQNVTWHQTIVRKDGPNFKKEETWHQSIIHFIDLRGRQIFELVIAAGILAHFVALIALLFALPGFVFFVVSMWVLISCFLFWAFLVSLMSIYNDWW